MRITLRRFNNGLSVIVIALCLYIILAPFMPNASLWWRKSVTKDVPELVKAAEQPDNAKQPMPRVNTLVIPRILMQEEIKEYATEFGLELGAWRRPQSGSPGNGLNTVITGHRFTYVGSGHGVFYHLDKVRKGDKIYVYWNKQKHTYIVDSILTVPPTATQIERRDVGEERLTLYTCTPLITATDRLVIQAYPENRKP